MKLLNTVEGKLVKRYKRFFSDVLLDSGEVVVAHTPNTGPMTTCWEEGMNCVLSKSDDPKRKLAYTLQLTKNSETYILVNTHLANKVVQEGLEEGKIKEVSSKEIRAEFKVGSSRFDFAIGKDQKTLLEVKNVSTIGKDRVAIFPDTRSERALKHVIELTKLQKEGFDCILLFLVSREDCDAVRPAKEIMPDYYKACQEAVKAGVKIIGYQCSITSTSCVLDRKVPVILD